jgi:AAA+ superfamily predicted ATPase
MPVQPSEWQEANQANLMAHLAVLKRRLARHAGRTGEEVREPEQEQAAFAGRPPALAELTDLLGLSAFERDILLLCAGIELDSEVAALCAAAQGDPAAAQPTFSLALAALPHAKWSALLPEAPLRHWRLIEIGAGPVLTRAPLRIDERVLHFLAGQRQFDQRLAVLLETLPPPEPGSMVPSQVAVAEQVAANWAGATRGRDLPVVQVCGTAADCWPIAAAAAAMLNLRAAVLPAERLPAGAADLDSLLRLWDREAMLSDFGVLVLDCDDSVAADSDAGRARDATIARLLDRATGPVLLREREPRRLATRQATVLDVTHPLASEQQAVWLASLDDDPALAGAVAAAAAQFSLSLPAIRAIAAEVRAQPVGSPPPDLGQVVWDLCRQRLRSALDGLAQRIESDLHWDDLVLPDAQKQTLHQLAAQLRQRTTVYDTWGFASASRRGLGISALFYGPSGTGKTMAAEVLASELRLDLYHIDLSRIVSKYIGQTEDNLRRVFDAAEENGAILLFDEADSLFGSRSEVKDSHDRYANIEVSYLLQRMEAYRGLAILTTNMRAALDQAFLRRIRFAVPFPFPDAPQRAAIWQRMFPPRVPSEGLNMERLGRLKLAGGSIRTIALNAAFLAAQAESPVQMRHLQAAVQAEYAKLERRPSPAESSAWA